MIVSFTSNILDRVSLHYQSVYPISNTKFITGTKMYADHLKFSAPSWKRPEGPPRVWRVIDGRRKTESGETPRFSIQEVPKELESDLVEYMTQNFLREEPICNDLGLADDPLALSEFRTLWREFVGQGMSIVALVVSSDPSAKPVIAGANILHVVTAEDKANADYITQYHSHGMKRFMQVMGRLAQEADALRIYDVDKYLGAIGLSVDPPFRKQGLGEELLRARDAIGTAYQIPVTETIFPSRTAQILASRVGFEVLIERKFSELLDEEGKVAFPGLTTGSIQVTGKRIC